MTEELKKATAALMNDKKVAESRNDDVLGKYEGDDWLNRPRTSKEKFSATMTALKLQVPERKGFRRHWVIEKEIPEFQRRDWAFVKGVDGQPLREVMNTGRYSREIKEPEYGVLMEIPEQYFQENMRSDDEERKALMQRRTPSQGQDANIEGEAYRQPTGIVNKIERNKPLIG